MSMQDRFQERYEKGDTPWDSGKPDYNLINIVTQKPILSCKATDIGCGTGNNAIWLAQHGFEVTASDVSDTAIQKAQEKATAANVKCTFIVGDFLSQEIADAPFGFAFDRGCFHAFDSDKERARFAVTVAYVLDRGGLWLSLVGNADEYRDAPGPPRRTAKDIVTAVEPYFKILSLESGYFDSNHPNSPKAWICLMQKREQAL